MGDEIRDFQLFVKPVGAECNLSCNYCYYLGTTGHSGNNSGIMSSEIAELLVSQQIEATTDDVVLFTWHGGEPTMAGKDFFENILKLQKANNSGNRRIINGIQTNGTLLDEGWIDFFADNDFVVGLSLDGPEHLHNQYRMDPSGCGSFSDAMDAWNLLLKKGVKHEILCALNNSNSRHPSEVYSFFKKNGAVYITFLPVVEMQPGGELSSFTVDPGKMGDFFINVFDEWKSKDIGKIEIQIIEEALRVAFNQEHSLCIFRKECGGVPVLEKDGSFYSCDHFVSGDYYQGNIKTVSVAEVVDSRTQKAFGRNKATALPSVCLKCEVLDFCNGGCPKNRFVNLKGETYPINYLCTGYRSFFNYVKPFVSLLKELS